MLITETHKKIMDSNLKRLLYGKETIGFRATAYNIDTDEYDVYDFSLEYIQDPAIRGELNRLQDEFKTLSLGYQGGMYVSHDEVKNGLRVKEFKDVKSAEGIVKHLLEVYSQRKR